MNGLHLRSFMYGVVWTLIVVWFVRVAAGYVQRPPVVVGGWWV